MANMQLNKHVMPEQAPEVRRANFKEVALGYDEQTAIEEAKRCLGCKTRPCVGGCPVGVYIPEFISEVANGRFTDAYKVLKEKNALPAICGRVCPQEEQCEGKCVRGIKGESVGIGRLERFVADWAMKNPEQLAGEEKAEENGHKVAVVGAGPAGLTCAGELAKLGYDVTVFEGLHVLGGVLSYGIPEFRLPKSIVEKETEGLKNIGVHFEKNYIVGRSASLDELLEDGYEAVFIGSGAGLPQFMNIPGENLNGVYSANEFLTRINLMKAYMPDAQTPIYHPKKAAVVGGGNVAMDAARCALRMGAEKVYIVYRRGMEEMPARAEEIHHAVEEGIIFKLLSAPVRVVGDDSFSVCGLEIKHMKLGEPDASGRPRPVPIEGSEEILDVDCVISAIGTTPNPLLRKTTPGLETNRKGCFIVEEDTCATSKKGVYAGGDAVTGAATVILAMGAGKKAAAAIDKYIYSKEN